MDKFVIGCDFGTDSVRSVIMNARNGDLLAAETVHYARWRDGKYCNPSLNQFRQHPLDYIESMETGIRHCLGRAGNAARENLLAISIDTTGSTPVAVDRQGTPLALLPPFADNPNAMFVLWKDHTAIEEAARINATAQHFEPNYLKYVGGIYSSEWFWAKLVHILESDPQIKEACYSWVEHCDWIPYLLIGGRDVHQMKRGVCSAGHKALWASEFGGLPPENFLTAISPALAGFRDRLFSDAYTADLPAGNLSAEWAARLGLSGDVVIGIGAFDAHMGAVGGQIEPYHLSKVMGTSTCDMLVAPSKDIEGKLVRGICGQVPGSIIPGMVGLEAGQSAFGDAYAWFRDLLAWPLRHLEKAETTNTDELISSIIPELSRQAAALPLDEGDPLGIDWFNGRRTPDADQRLKGALFNLQLGTDAPRLFRAIAESTCMGARAIVDRFVQEGIPVKGLIGMGGVAKKSPYIMQMMADVMNMPLRIHQSEQTCAAGAAMFAATAGGYFKKVEEAMKAMGCGFSETYRPDPVRSAYYARRLEAYTRVGAFVESQTSHHSIAAS